MYRIQTNKGLKVVHNIRFAIFELYVISKVTDADTDFI